MISYAQNLEDVVLNRLFQDKPSGFYIDIGAHDPTELSVTRHFYDLGWRGINIEPIPGSFENIKEQRPRDTNLNLAVGAQHDILPIYELVGRPDLSTLNQEIASAAGKQIDVEVRTQSVEVRTLAEICEKHCDGLIDFIKIDVEGGEKDVILGADWKRFRPTMLVVEATSPCKAIISDWKDPDKHGVWEEWESLVSEAAYILVYYDGLNRYYLRKEDEHLKNHYSIPITPLQDSYSLHSDLRITWEAQKQVDALKNDKSGLIEKVQVFEAEKAQFQKEQAGLTKTVQALESDKAGLIGKVEGLDAEKAQLQAEQAGLAKTIQALENEKSRLLEEKQAHEEKAQKLVSDISDQEERIFKLVEENSGLFGQINELEAEKKSLSQNLTGAQTESGRLSNLLEEEKKISGILHETQQKLSNTQARIKELEEQFGEANKVNGDLLETLEGLTLDLEKQRRLNEIVKCTLEEERAVSPLSRGLKQFLPFRSHFEGIAHAHGEGKGGLAPLKAEEARHSGELSELEFEKDGVEEEKLVREKNRTQKDKTAKQEPDYSRPCPGQIHAMLGIGWDKTASAVRKEVERAGLAFISELELELGSGKEMPQGQWIAISHVPVGLPEWITDTDAYKPFTAALFTSKAWDSAKRRCQRIFTFSGEHAKKLVDLTGIKTTALKHPFPEVSKKWTYEAFESNQEKAIMQTGWWLKRMHAIYLLPESNYKKLWIRSPEPDAAEFFEIERNNLKKRNLFFDHMEKDVTVFNDLPLKVFEERLCANIVFAHYYDTSAPSFLLECIARHTPILVNALPAVREYLGDDYPLYYYFYKDAVEKAADIDLVRKAHEHLKHLSGKMTISPKALALQIRNAMKEN